MDVMLDTTPWSAITCDCQNQCNGYKGTTSHFLREEHWTGTNDTAQLVCFLSHTAWKVRSSEVASTWSVLRNTFTTLDGCRKTATKWPFALAPNGPMKHCTAPRHVNVTRPTRNSKGGRRSQQTDSSGGDITGDGGGVDVISLLRSKISATQHTGTDAFWVGLGPCCHLQPSVEGL